MDLSRFYAKAESLGLLNLRGWKDGREITGWDRDGEIRRNQYSASKSFTSAAVGIAMEEGLLSLDEPLTQAFSQDIPDNPGENLMKATVRDLLTMALGQEKGYLMGEQRPFLKERDWVRYSLSLPFTIDPGSKFVYNNVGPYLAGILVQRRAGCNLVEYLTPRLFQPLGIVRPTWEEDPLGNTFGAGGLFLCVSELLLFGRLLLDKGMWNGKSLIPAAYLQQATGKQVENGQDGYGYLFWRGRDNTYRADGKYGQFAIVFPEENAVIATNAQAFDQNQLLALLMKHHQELLEN